MTSNFNLRLYLCTKHQYRFSYPVDSNEQGHGLQSELGLSSDEWEDWKPNWQSLPMYERQKFLDALSNDFSYVSESQGCREIAMSKGQFYTDWIIGMGVIFRTSYTTLSYPEQIPEPFKKVVTEALLTPYAVNREGSDIICNLDDPHFGIGMNPGYWNKAWLSLLTYFAKYGEYMWEIGGGDYKDHYTLEQTIQAILDSWSGQVGFYTAFGLWLWADRRESAIHANYTQFSGIHNAMDHYSTLYVPDDLLEFIVEFGLSTDRVSRLYLNIHKERCESAGLALPSWYTSGGDNDRSLAESPEWNDYMGYDDDDDDEDYENYDDDEDYNFEEDW